MLFHKYTKKYYFYEVKRKRGKKNSPIQPIQGKRNAFVTCIELQWQKIHPNCEMFDQIRNKDFHIQHFPSKFWAKRARGSDWRPNRCKRGLAMDFFAKGRLFFIHVVGGKQEKAKKQRQGEITDEARSGLNVFCMLV